MWLPHPVWWAPGRCRAAGWQQERRLCPSGSCQTRPLRPRAGSTCDPSSASTRPCACAARTTAPGTTGRRRCRLRPSWLGAPLWCWEPRVLCLVSPGPTGRVVGGGPAGQKPVGPSAQCPPTALRPRGTGPESPETGARLEPSEAPPTSDLHLSGRNMGPGLFQDQHGHPCGCRRARDLHGAQHAGLGPHPLGDHYP